MKIQLLSDNVLNNINGGAAKQAPPVTVEIIQLTAPGAGGTGTSANAKVANPGFTVLDVTNILVSSPLGQLLLGSDALLAKLGSSIRFEPSNYAGSTGVTPPVAY
jgi:hypothetical protein